tara:strand:+ start:1904 stop:2701 length:798 start_codon:yes stop_codon:yes gene_type:complete
MRIGDLINSFILTNSIVFLGTIILQHNNYVNIFDKSYISDGFCISNKEKSILFQTHALCFYFDIAFCFVLNYLVNNCKINDNKKEVILSPIKEQIPGLFLHGLGHLGIPYLFDTTQNLNGTLAGISTNYGKGFSILTTISFWYFIMYSINSTGYLPFWKLHVILHSFLSLFIVPTLFNFTHTQTTIFITGSISNLLKNGDKKDIYYDFLNIFIGLPIALMPWVEAIYCENFAINYGGHLLYDISIPLSCIIYYNVCCYYNKNKTD